MQADEQATSAITAASVQDLREGVHILSRKLERLMDLYIAQDVEREDYLVRRRSLMLEKKSLEERIALLERDAGYWLEPMRTFISEAKQAGIIALQENLSAKKDFLQKIGSNPRLAARRLMLDPREPWQFLAHSHPRPAPAAADPSDSDFVLLCSPYWTSSELPIGLVLKVIYSLVVF